MLRGLLESKKKKNNDCVEVNGCGMKIKPCG